MQTGVSGMCLYRPALLEFTQGTSSRERTSLVDGMPVAVSWSQSQASTGEGASHQEACQHKRWSPTAAPSEECPAVPALFQMMLAASQLKSPLSFFLLAFAS